MPGATSDLFFLFLLIYSQLIAPTKARKRASQAHQNKPIVVPRGNQYLRTIILVTGKAGVALLFALLNRLPVFGTRHLDLKTFLWATGFLAIILICTDPLEWKFTPAETKKKILDYFPRTNHEQLIWTGVSLATAISEEIVYRAVFFGLLYHLTGIYWVAAVSSAILFAYAHRRWGRITVGSIFVVGLVLQWFVFVSGGLYVSIAVHFIHNLVNGVVYGMLREKRLESEGSVAEGRERALAQ